MKQLQDFNPHAIRLLVEEEGWNEPLAEVHRIRLSTTQQAIFWGLRMYAVIMTVVVVWAFLHGAGS